MLIYDSGDYIFIFLLMASLVLATIAIPFYSFLHKGWKGLGLGCLFQPVVAFILCMLVGLGAFLIQKRSLDRYHKAAMTVVRTTEKVRDSTLVYTWFLKPDGECLCESRMAYQDSTDLAFDLNLFDVVRLDSFSLCVDDRIVVRFNLDSCSASATEFDKPIDLVRVDWPSVQAYFHGQ